MSDVADLTAEQRELFHKMRPAKATVPSGGQTPEQAMNAAVDDFFRLCRLEGVDEPEESTVREAFAAFALPVEPA